MRPDYAHIKQMEIALGFRQPDPPVLTPIEQFHRGILDEFTYRHYDYQAHHSLKSPLSAFSDLLEHRTEGLFTRPRGRLAGG